MSKITDQELTLLRTQPHSTKLWLSIYQPPTVFAARVNDVDIAKGEYLITYDSLSAGSRLLVESGMTLWVGSAAGLDDYGKVRVRSITASVITVAENDHINWADNLYLTIVSFYEINAIYPRIIQDPADELNVIFYKDYDIVYTDQNSVLGSFVNMGPHHAGFLEGGTHAVYYSASGTSNLKADALTYAWFFQGGTVTGSTSQTPGNINYTSPGQYTTRLVVSNASGGTDTSYRHVSIYDRPENGSNNPILLWSLEQLTGAKENGGYNGRVKIRQSISNTLLKDGSLVVIFADDTYGGTNQSIGGNAPGRAKIVFVGYVIDGSIEYDYADSSVEFDVGSPSEIMKISEGFSISVESKAAPTTWYELLNMTVKRALYHYLKWHSTFPMTNDVSFLGTDQKIQFFDADRESLYDAAHTLISSALIGGATCDRQGKLWFEVNGYTAGITLETNFTLDNQDWIGKPEIDQQQNNQISFIETGGIAYDGPTLNTFQALLASAPGDAPAYKGKLNRFQGLALASQAQLNRLVGDIYAYQNSEFPLSTFSLAGNYRNFDLAPQEDILINMGAAQNVRGVSFFGKKFLVTNIDWVYLSREEFFYPLVSFVQDTQGFDGDTIIIPDVPDVGGFGNTPPFDFPPFNIPPFNCNFETVLDLYDEGNLQGQFDELDFQGVPVTAVMAGETGVITFVCDPNPSIDGIVVYGNGIVTGSVCVSEQFVDLNQNFIFNNGYNFLDQGLKIEVEADGVYNFTVSAQLTIGSTHLCPELDTRFSATVTLYVYDSSDVLKVSSTFDTDAVYCYESASSGLDIAIETARGYQLFSYGLEATDYIKIGVQMDDCPGTGTVAIRVDYVIFRIS